MRVLISGAGIAGPTLAWFLQRIGARITIVEKSPSILPYGQNVDISGSAITAIRKMGLLEQFRQLNTTEKGTRFIDPKGRPIAPFPLTKGSSTSPTSEFEILRGDLAALLYEATKDSPNVEYVFGTTVKQVLSNNDEGVKVALSNGQEHEYDLLVAADGQWSKVRTQCFQPESVDVVDLGLFVGYWTIPRLAIDDDWWNVYIALGSRAITLRPDPHGTIRAMFTSMPCNDTQKNEWIQASRSDRKTQEALMRKDFSDAGWQAPRILEAMDKTPDFYFQRVQQIKMSTWSQSRVVCLGDTAYAPTPLTGMGTSLAIIGAYVLAGELSKLGRDEHPSKALEAYESTLRPFVEQTQKIPPFVPGFMHPETAWKRWLLQSGMSTLSRVAAFPWFASRLPDAESRDDGFPLPQYSEFDGKNALSG